MSTDTPFKNPSIRRKVEEVIIKTIIGGEYTVAAQIFCNCHGVDTTTTTGKVFYELILAVIVAENSTIDVEVQEYIKCLIWIHRKFDQHKKFVGMCAAQTFMEIYKYLHNNDEYYKIIDIIKNLVNYGPWQETLKRMFYPTPKNMFNYGFESKMDSYSFAIGHRNAAKFMYNNPEIWAVGCSICCDTVEHDTTTWCHDSLENGTVRFLDCPHIFHTKCVKQLFNHSNKCEKCENWKNCEHCGKCVKCPNCRVPIRLGGRYKYYLTSMETKY